MEMTIFVYSILLLGVMGFITGFGLAYLAKKFEVKEDPRVEKIIKVLPGANCGMCGYPGCSAYAHAIVEKGASYDKCVPGKKSGVAEKIKKIMEEES